MNIIRIPSILIFAFLTSCQTPNEKLIDIDGNEYAIRQFGDDIWTIENLKVKTGNNGKQLSYFVPNGDSGNIETYGLLYDFENACKVCPKGWRLPTNEEWETLLNFKVNDNASDFKDSSLWGENNSNITSFSARPTGIGNNAEHPDNFGENTLFWSSSKEDEHFIWTYIFEKGKNTIRKAAQHPTYAFSVRCIKERN